MFKNRVSVVYSLLQNVYGLTYEIQYYFSFSKTINFETRPSVEENERSSSFTIFMPASLTVFLNCVTVSQVTKQTYVILVSNLAEINRQKELHQGLYLLQQHVAPLLERLRDVNFALL